MFANSSREQRRMDTKLSKITDALDPLQEALDHFTVYPPTGPAEGGGLAASII